MSWNQTNYLQLKNQASYHLYHCSLTTFVILYHHILLDKKFETFFFRKIWTSQCHWSWPKSHVFSLFVLKSHLPSASNNYVRCLGHLEKYETRLAPFMTKSCEKISQIFAKILMLLPSDLSSVLQSTSACGLEASQKCLTNSLWCS